MLPNISLTDSQLKELLSFKYIGDVVDTAGKISMQLFRDIQEQKPDYRLDRVDLEKMNEAIEGQNMVGIPKDMELKYISFASYRQQLKRAIIFSIVNNPSNNLNLSEDEKVLLSGFLNIGSLFDQLYIDWRKEVLYSDLA